MNFRKYIFAFLFFSVAVIYSQNADLYPYYSKGKWGFADTSGKIIIKSEYEWADEFFEGMACVQKKGKYGFVNVKGKLVVPAQFDSPSIFKGGIAQVKNAVGNLFYDKSGKVILSSEIKTSLEKKFRSKFSDQFTSYYFLLSGFTIAGKDTITNKQNNQLQALLDGKGNIIVPRREWKISPFTNTLFYAAAEKGSYLYDKDGNIVLRDIATVSYKSGGDILIRTKSGFDYIDSLNDKIIALKPEYADVNRINDALLLFTVNKKNKQYYGLVNTDGNEIVAGKNSFLGKLAEGKFIARDAFGMFGAYDTSGKLVVPFDFEFLDRFSEGLALAKKNGSWMYINQQGKQIFKTDFEYKMGITDEIEPEGITSYVNGELYCFSDGLAVCFQSGKAGYINRFGKIVIEPVYDFAEPFHNGLANVFVADSTDDIKRSKEITRIMINKEGEGIISVAKPVKDFTNADCVQFPYATFVESGEDGWMMFNSKGERASVFSFTKLYPKIYANGKFMKVSTKDVDGLFIRADGKLFSDQ